MTFGAEVIAEDLAGVAEEELTFDGPVAAIKGYADLKSDTRSGTLVEVGKTEAIPGDLIVGCRILNMNGEVKGNVLAGGLHLTVGNTVDRNLTIGGYSIKLQGNVGKDAQLAGANIEIDGTIDGDLMVFGANVNIPGNVSGDLTVGGGKVFISGKVGGSLNARCGDMVIDGTIGRNVSLTASKLTLSSTAVLNGNLTYTSNHSADIAEGAQIAGEVRRSAGRGMIMWTLASVMADRFPEHPERWREWRVELPTWTRILLRLSSFFSLLLAGGIIISVYERHATMVADRLTSFPLKSLGLGLLFLICFPIGALILCLTIIGLPIGLVALAVYVAFSYVSTVYVALAIGREILDRVTKQDIRIIWQMILGLFIITGLSIIPYYIGLIVRLICILLGLGGMLMTRKVRMARAQEA